MMHRNIAAATPFPIRCMPDPRRRDSGTPKEKWREGCGRGSTGADSPESNFVSQETSFSTFQRARTQRRHCFLSQGDKLLARRKSGNGPSTVAKMTHCHGDAVKQSENCHEGVVRVPFSVFLVSQSVHLHF
ncbi:hypothetical protein [Sphingopyxis sp. PET50]|uniref:hypothetical protein n=1 Tax=Sphingopyxis sp. PET50 TaxID=2976533 RepID=UPI0021B0022F|nr:hypothetical protein [Sphingopyxis sp. PET50]